MVYFVYRMLWWWGRWVWGTGNSLVPLLFVPPSSKCTDFNLDKIQCNAIHPTVIFAA